MRDTKGGFWLVHTWCTEKLLVDKNDDKKLDLRRTTNRNLKTAVALFGFACLPSGAGRPELQTKVFYAATILFRFKKQCNREQKWKQWNICLCENLFSCPGVSTSGAPKWCVGGVVLGWQKDRGNQKNLSHSSFSFLTPSSPTVLISHCQHHLFAFWWF